MSNNPTATVVLDKPYTVVMNARTIGAIEQRLGKSCIEIGQELLGVDPDSTEDKPGVDSGRANRTFRIGTVVGFLEACVPQKERGDLDIGDIDMEVLGEAWRVVLALYFPAISRLHPPERTEEKKTELPPSESYEPTAASTAASAGSTSTPSTSTSSPTRSKRSKSAASETTGDGECSTPPSRT